MDLVVGGAGFTGRAVVDALVAVGRRVRVLDLVRPAQPGVEWVEGSLCDPAAAARACAGVERVFHTAAIVTQHPRREAAMYAVNVDGTRTLLAAARAAGVRGFIYTSSIDAVYDGNPIAGGDEKLPYPARFLNRYCESKAVAEQAVLAENSEGFRTVALRSAGTWGPGDHHRVPVVVEHARRSGYVRLGDGSARFSHVYVENVAEAHVRAGAALDAGRPVHGRAYFVVDHAPQNFYDFLEPFVRAAGVTGPAKRLPTWLASTLARLEGFAFAVMPPAREPMLTPYAVAATCRDFWFIGDAAAADLGYVPVVTAEEGTRRTLSWMGIIRGPQPA